MTQTALDLWQKWYPTSHCPLPSLSTSRFPFFTLHPSPPHPTSTPPPKSCLTPHLACPEGPRAEALIEPAKAGSTVAISTTSLLAASTSYCITAAWQKPRSGSSPSGLECCPGIPQAHNGEEPHTHGHSLQGGPKYSLALLLFPESVPAPGQNPGKKA